MRQVSSCLRGRLLCVSSALVCVLEIRCATAACAAGLSQDAVATPLVGLGSDATTGFPQWGLGKRKIWNFAGVLLVTLSYTFVFAVCAPCLATGHPVFYHEDSSFQTQKTIALAIACAIFNLGWAAVQVSHMSLVPELTTQDGKRVLLNAVRYGNTILSNLIVFLTMFTLLHVLNGGSNSNKERPEVYLDLALVVMSLGGVCSLAFLVLLRERPPAELEQMLRFEKYTQRLLAKADQVGAVATRAVHDDFSQDGGAFKGASAGLSAPAPSGSSNAHLDGHRTVSSGSKTRTQSVAEAFVDILDTAGTALDAHPVPRPAHVWSRRCRKAHPALVKQRSSSFHDLPSPAAEGPLRAASPGSTAMSVPDWRRVLSADAATGPSFDMGGLVPVQDRGASPDPVPPEPLALAGIPATLAEASDSDDEDDGTEPYAWYDWFWVWDFYIVGMNYMCTRVVVNISQVYLPFYVTATLNMDATSIALVPLLVYIASFLTTLVAKPLNARLGRRLTYALGTVLAGLACTAMLLLDPKHSYLVYPASMVLGAGNAVLMVTTVSFEADLVGSGCASGAFVYGCFSLLDKASNGGLILAIQFLQPLFDAHADQKSLFIRLVVAAVPLAAALLGALNTIVFIPRKFAQPCKPKTPQVGPAQRGPSAAPGSLNQPQGALQQPLLEH